MAGEPWYALSQTYHILLSSITIVLYVKEIFEKWRQVVNKTKIQNQASK
ncbi:MAG TPA: hypothetical protein VKA95_13070 [Nitrososphaeraceae archaeon]|nr:hypothetical protein [Nitrososphaeraceae archaeon]